MAVVFPLTFPSTVPVKGVILEAQTAVGMTRSPFSFSQQTVDMTGQSWNLQITTDIMDQDEASDLEAFLFALNGREGTFLFGDPARTAPRGVGTGTPVVDGASQTGTTLNTTGWTPTTTGILLKGDNIQLGSGANTYLHKVLNDVDSDGSGDAAIDLWPRLRVSPADTSAIVVTNPKGRFRLANNKNKVSIKPPTLYNTTIQAIEAIT